MFIELASYYQKFIADFSAIAEPMSRLTRKYLKFHWGDEQQMSMDRLKELLSTEPVLGHFDHSAPTKLRTDASGYGIGAVLLQDHGDGFKPICYISRLLTVHEKNYTISEKECLAIVDAIQKLKHHVAGSKFIVETDHCSVFWLKSKANLPPRLLRWALVFQQYDYEIVYRSGKLHKDADCLSRYPVGAEEIRPVQSIQLEEVNSIIIKIE